MRWILKIIVFPIILILSILAILSFLIALLSLSALVNKDTTTFIQVIIIAFLISPYGLPKIAMWIVAYIELARDMLKEI